MVTTDLGLVATLASEAKVLSSALANDLSLNLLALASRPRVWPWRQAFGLKVNIHQLTELFAL